MTISLHSSTSAPAIAIVGNYPPRQCGIATFTHDLRMALDQLGPDTRCLAIAVQDALGPYDYAPGAVMVEIDQEDPAAYVAAAERINRAGIRLSASNMSSAFLGAARVSTCSSCFAACVPPLQPHFIPF